MQAPARPPFDPLPAAGMQPPRKRQLRPHSAVSNAPTRQSLRDAGVVPSPRGNSVWRRRRARRGLWRCRSQLGQLGDRAHGWHRRAPRAAPAAPADVHQAGPGQPTGRRSQSPPTTGAPAPCPLSRAPCWPSGPGLEASVGASKRRLLRRPPAPRALSCPHCPGTARRLAWSEEMMGGQRPGRAEATGRLVKRSGRAHHGRTVPALLPGVTREDEPRGGRCRPAATTGRGSARWVRCTDPHLAADASPSGVGVRLRRLQSNGYPQAPAGRATVRPPGSVRCLTPEPAPPWRPR